MLDHRQHHLDVLRAGLATLVYPVYTLVNLPLAGTHWLQRNLASRAKLLAENAQLRRQHLLLEARLQRLAALEVENSRLRKLFDSSSKVSERVLIAEIIAINPDPFTHQVVLNKGSRHAVKVGQPLLDAFGIMGQVITVGPFTSNALLITDASHALPVQVNRNGLRAIIVGVGAFDQLELIYVPDTADIHVDDLLVTSGLGGRFPPGYPVATVTQVTHDPGQPYAQVRARPTARLERSREVLLVRAAPREVNTPMQADPLPVPSP